MPQRPDAPRELFAGPDAGPEPPFPIKLHGPVIKGFGRGSKELGIPTANIPPEGLSAYPDLESGVYYGFVGLRLSSSTSKSTSTTTQSQVQTEDSQPAPPQPPTQQILILPSVLSIGYNPFYANKTRSIEIHILHSFSSDFYGSALNLLILGFIRPEYNYESVEKLIEDIKMDCDVARNSLQRGAYQAWTEQRKGESVENEAGGNERRQDDWLRDFKWMENVDVGQVERDVLKGDQQL